MYSPFRHLDSVLVKKRPIHLTFFVTRKCNAKCPFCFYLRSDDTETVRDEELSADEIRKISSSFGSILWLAFSGGEIFLREDLPEISRIFYKNNRPAIMLFPTNGMLPARIKEMTEEILRDCTKSIIAVKLSLDGLSGIHDRLRNTPGSFIKTMETYHQLKGLLDQYPNFELGVNTVFCSENQDHMDDIIDFVSGMDSIKTHTISLVRGNLADMSFSHIDRNKYCRAIDRLEENLKKKGASKTYSFRGGRIKAAQDILQRDLISKTLVEKKQLIPCYAGLLNIVIEETGETFPCEILRQSLGNIRDHGYNIQKLLASDMAIATLNSIKESQCFCTHECYFMTNILFNPRLYPALLRQYLQIA